MTENHNALERIQTNELAQASTIILPSTPEAAADLLDQAGRLETAVGWYRAVMVYLMTPTEDAITEVVAHGFRGLKSAKMVRAYREAMQRAIDEGVVAEPRYGQPFEIPEANWDDYKPIPDAANLRRLKLEDDQLDEIKALADQHGVAHGTLARSFNSRAATDVLIKGHPEQAKRAAEALGFDEETMRSMILSGRIKDPAPALVKSLGISDEAMAYARTKNDQPSPIVDRAAEQYEADNRGGGGALIKLAALAAEINRNFDEYLAVLQELEVERDSDLGKAVAERTERWRQYVEAVDAAFAIDFDAFGVGE